MPRGCSGRGCLFNEAEPALHCPERPPPHPAQSTARSHTRHLRPQTVIYTYESACTACHGTGTIKPYGHPPRGRGGRHRACTCMQCHGMGEFGKAGLEACDMHACMHARACAWRRMSPRSHVCVRRARRPASARPRLAGMAASEALCHLCCSHNSSATKQCAVFTWGFNSMRAWGASSALLWPTVGMATWPPEHMQGRKDGHVTQ